ncbi:MAG: GIY-YIG nuclease family protein [Dehalococcoidia bacterium]|nr:GIY-YIG nuclease family protein [Dehalococcoidia bacterium]
MSEYYVYMLANVSGTLYVGVTSDLHRRVFQHRQKLVEGFTRKYNVTMLVYFETTNDVGSAITREKQIKSWRRSKKIALVESLNPEWRDLSAGWYETRRDPALRSG